MNYNFISQLLDNGLSEEELIASLSKSVPRLAKKAKQMFFGGWSPKDILGVFSKDKEVQKVARKGLKPVTPSEMAAMHLQSSYNNIPQSQEKESKEQLTNFTKKVAPYAIGAIASPIAGSVIQGALQRALPQTEPLNEKLSNQIQNQQQTPVQETNINPLNNVTPQQPPANQVAENIPEPANIQQPKGFDTNIIKNSLAYKRQIDALIKSGNGPEEIEGYLKKFNPQFIKTIEKEGKGAFKDIVAQYIQEGITKEAMEPEGSIPTATNSPIEKQEATTPNKALEPEKPIEPTEPIKIEKKSIVSSPNGIGELKELRNGVGLVEVDGKLHKVKEEDLEASPIPEKDLASLHDDLLRGIESETGEDVSRMVQWAGYNPDTNTLQFLPHSGKLYKYGNISPEDAALLTDILSTRKTSGSNFIGAWKKDSKSPIGAALSKLIRKLQSERGGKGQEYEETHEPIYSAYEPAIEAKKKKKKK